MSTLAFMVEIDGELRQICADCGVKLAAVGMVKVVDSFELGNPTYTVVLYKMIEGTNMDDCKAFIRGEHPPAVVP